MHCVVAIGQGMQQRLHHAIHVGRQQFQCGNGGRHALGIAKLEFLQQRGPGGYGMDGFLHWFDYPTAAREIAKFDCEGDVR